MILFKRDGTSADIPDNVADEAIASGEYADHLGWWGIETCPGAEPDPYILLRREALAAESVRKEPINEEVDADSLSVGSLRAALEARGIEYDKRWGAKRLAEALNGDGA